MHGSTTTTPVTLDADDQEGSLPQRIEASRGDVGRARGRKGCGEHQA